MVSIVVRIDILIHTTGAVKDLDVVHDPIPVQISMKGSGLEMEFADWTSCEEMDDLNTILEMSNDGIRRHIAVVIPMVVGPRLMTGNMSMVSSMSTPMMMPTLMRGRGCCMSHITALGSQEERKDAPPLDSIRTSLMSLIRPHFTAARLQGG